MLTDQQKPESIAYWNQKAAQWDSLAYDPKKTYQHFPTSLVRQKESVDLATKHLAHGSKILDIGCATGQLVLDLRQTGFDAHGIDNALEMIQQARKNLAAKDSAAKADTVFRHQDIDSTEFDASYHGVTAMGLLEYVTDRDQFFRRLNRMLKPSGMAFIESRNRLFNLYSANNYVTQTAERGDLAPLVRQIAEVDRFSPQSITESADLIRSIYQKIGQEMQNFTFEKAMGKREMKYPFQLPQYTPEELQQMGAKAGMTLKYVVYYHFHPFIPRLENALGPLFNKLAILMQPLGRTSLGATFCSAFIAVFEKTQEAV